MRLINSFITKLLGGLLIIPIGFSTPGWASAPFWHYTNLDQIKPDVIQAYRQFVNYHYQVSAKNSRQLSLKADCVDRLVFRKNTYHARFGSSGSLFSSLDDAKQPGIKEIKKICKVKNSYVIIKSPMTSSTSKQVSSLATTERGIYRHYLRTKNKFGVQVNVVKDENDKVEGIVTTFLW